MVRIGGPTSGIFVAGRRDIFIPLFKDDCSGYYVLPVKAPSFRAAGLKPDITLQRRPRSDGSVFNVATTDASGKELPAASLATPSSSVSTASRKRGLSEADIEMGSTIDAQDAHKNTDGATSAVSMLLKNAALAKHVQRVHEKLGHVDLKRIFKFKRHGKVVCANLPSKFLKAYRQAAQSAWPPSAGVVACPRLLTTSLRWLSSSLGRSHTSTSAGLGAFLQAVAIGTTACLSAASMYYETSFYRIEMLA